MFTTNCDAVSTKSWFCAASASSVRWCFAVSATTTPSAATTTRAVTSDTRATSARWGCLRGGGPAGRARSNLDRLRRLDGHTRRRGHRTAGRSGRPRRTTPCRRLRRVASKPCLRSSTPALEPTSDQPSFPRAPVCQFHLRTRQFPRLGRRKSRSGRTWRSSGHSPAAAPRPVAAARPQAEVRLQAVAPAAAAAHPPAGGGGVLPYGGTTWSGGA